MVAVNGKEHFLDQITSLKGRIQMLENEKQQLEAALQKKRDDTARLFSMTSEVVRLRRLMEYDGDTIKALTKENEELKVKLEDAERSVRNMKRWMQINGVEGKT